MGKFINSIKNLFNSIEFTEFGKTDTSRESISSPDIGKCTSFTVSFKADGTPYISSIDNNKKGE